MAFSNWNFLSIWFVDVHAISVQSGFIIPANAAVPTNVVPYTGATKLTNFNGQSLVNVGNLTASTATIGSLSLTGTTASLNGNLSVTGTVTATNLSAAGIVTNTSGGQLGTTTSIPVANGGTGLTSAPTNGQILIGNGTGYTLATLTAGTGITSPLRRAAQSHTQTLLLTPTAWQRSKATLPAAQLLRRTGRTRMQSS